MEEEIEELYIGKLVCLLMAHRHAELCANAVLLL